MLENFNAKNFSSQVTQNKIEHIKSLSMDKSNGYVIDTVLNKSNRDGLVVVYIVCTKPSSAIFES